ncbi:MAG: beta-eliminating lyase-related protein [Paracoccus sp. (in: a-proteobacteria)]|nr:beta-eliminating lyase-related protein [Paracoccus sp. (in: a-proteobacteria)]
MNFASDNAAGVHPAVMAAIMAANDGSVPSYGADALSLAAEEMLREALGAPDAAVLFVATGTAANAIALGGAVAPWARIFCHEHAHIETSECGAPEFFTHGAKLSLLSGEGGLIDADALDQAASFWAGEGLGGGRPAAISITNATEWGRIWQPDALAEISAIARQHGLCLHMDGARFANAVAAGGVSAAALSHGAGVDILSFGGTKNGAMGAEAVIAFDPAMAERLAHLRKRGGHLLSKHRYLAAQFYALLQDDLWLRLAAHANDMAQMLAGGLTGAPGARLLQPVETNQIFVTLPTDAEDRAREAGARFHRWSPMGGEGPAEVSLRFVTSWNTTEAEVLALLDVLTAP